MFRNWIWRFGTALVFPRTVLNYCRVLELQLLNYYHQNFNLFGPFFRTGLVTGGIVDRSIVRGEWTNQDRSTTRAFERLAESGDLGHDGHVPRDGIERPCPESPVERRRLGWLRSHKQQDRSLQTQQKRQTIGPEPHRHQSQHQTKTSIQPTQFLTLHFSLTALPSRAW